MPGFGNCAYAKDQIQWQWRDRQLPLHESAVWECCFLRASKLFIHHTVVIEQLFRSSCNFCEPKTIPRHPSTSHTALSTQFLAQVCWPHLFVWHKSCTLLSRYIVSGSVYCNCQSLHTNSGWHS